MTDEWVDLTPAAKTTPDKADVRFGLQKIRGGRARAVVLLRRKVLQDLDMQVWRVRVRLGGGGRMHQLAIIPDLHGLFEMQEVGINKGGGVFRVRLPVIERFPDARFPAAEVSWKIEQHAKAPHLVIDLPPFCWNPESARKFERRHEVVS